TSDVVDRKPTRVVEVFHLHHVIDAVAVGEGFLAFGSPGKGISAIRQSWHGTFMDLQWPQVLRSDMRLIADHYVPKAVYIWSDDPATRLDPKYMPPTQVFTDITVGTPRWLPKGAYGMAIAENQTLCALDHRDGNFELATYTL